MSTKKEALEIYGSVELIKSKADPNRYRSVFFFLEVASKIKKSESAWKDHNWWYYQNLSGDILEIKPKTRLIDYGDGRGPMKSREEMRVRWNARRVVAHCYSGIETHIIESLDLDPNTHILYHDGFITNEDIDLNSISNGPSTS